MNRPNPPKAIDIVMYWESVGSITLDDGRIKNMMTDFGEPKCQACGCWSQDWDIGEFSGNWDNDSKLINKRWEHSDLQKAHIIGYASGGSNDPSNFLMLCPFCHYAFDNYTGATWGIGPCEDYSKELYQWLFNRSKEKERILLESINTFVKQRSYDYDKFLQCFAKSWKSFGARSKHLTGHIKDVINCADILYLHTLSEEICIE